MKRSYIKRISRKKARQLEEERALKNQLLLYSGSKCELPHCNNPAAHKHEIIERSSCGDPTDPFNCILLCLSCHSIQHRTKEGRRYTDEELFRHIIPRRIAQGFQNTREHDNWMGEG